jgi:hypothetical protein
VEQQAKQLTTIQSKIDAKMGGGSPKVGKASGTRQVMDRSRSRSASARGAVAEKRDASGADESGWDSMAFPLVNKEDLKYLTGEIGPGPKTLIPKP